MSADIARPVGAMYMAIDYAWQHGVTRGIDDLRPTRYLHGTFRPDIGEPPVFNENDAAFDRIVAETVDNASTHNRQHIVHRIRAQSCRLIAGNTKRAGRSCRMWTHPICNFSLASVVETVASAFDRLTDLYDDANMQIFRPGLLG